MLTSEPPLDTNADRAKPPSATALTRRAFTRSLALGLAAGACSGVVEAAGLAGRTVHLRLTNRPKDQTPQHDYYMALLKLAMQKGAEGGAPSRVELHSHSRPQTLDRAFAELKAGRIDVVWSATSPEREADFLPVRISLLRELNSFRLLVIRKGDQARFDAVRTLADLRRLRAGSGQQWSATVQLRRNGLPVVPALHHERLFNMLTLDRSDYVPLGAYEVAHELSHASAEGLAVEQGLLLYMHLPMYFFVRKDSTALARRIERGLERALGDGSFDRLLLSVPTFSRGLKALARPGRKLLMLDGPGRPSPQHIHKLYHDLVSRSTARPGA